MCRLRHGHAGGGGGLADARSIAEPMVNSANLAVCGSQAVEYSPQATGVLVLCAVSQAQDNGGMESCLGQKY